MRFGIPISWVRPGFTIGVLLLASVFIIQNDALDRVFRVGNSAILKAVILGLIGLLLGALRWASIGRLAGMAVPLRFYLKWTFAAHFASTFFPRTLAGDSLRTIWLSIPVSGNSPQEHPQARRWRASSIVKWDLSISVMALALIGIPSLFAAVSHCPLLLAEAGISTKTAIAFTVAALIGLMLFSYASPNSQVRDRIGTAKDQILKASLNSLTQPWRTGFHFLLSIVIHLLTCQALWLLAQGLHLDLGGSDAIDLIVFSGLAAVVPISLNGAGLRELVFAGYFRLKGWDVVDGVVLGILMTGIQTLISMSGSLHFFQIMNSFRLSVPARRRPDESSRR